MDSEIDYISGTYMILFVSADRGGGGFTMSDLGGPSPEREILDSLNSNAHQPVVRQLVLNMVDLNQE